MNLQVIRQYFSSALASLSRETKVRNVNLFRVRFGDKISAQEVLTLDRFIHSLLTTIVFQIQRIRTWNLSRKIDIARKITLEIQSTGFFCDQC